MSKTYLQQPVTALELRDLARLAREEEDAFFARNPQLVAAALCQGAALQFVGRGYGVADFDIHFFYRQNPTKPRLSRAVKRLTANVGHFDRAPIDFVRTVVPAWLCALHEAESEGLLRAFLEREPTANAHHLAQKALVGLVPDALFGKVIWG
jgi:hypothetical protein